MNSFVFNDMNGQLLLWQVLIGLLVGIAAGGLFFTSLQRLVQAIITGSVWLAMATQLLRFTLLAIVLFVLAKWGAIALLTATIGFTLVRHYLVRKQGIGV